MNGMVRSVMYGSANAHSGWKLATTPELAKARDVRRIDQLQVRDVVAVPEIAIGLARGLDRIQRLADRAVADRVEMHLESVGIERGDALLEQFRLDHRDAAHLLLPGIM